VEIILLLKLIHIISAVLFLGNITIAILWKMISHKSKDRQRIAFTFEGIIKSDRVFTMPSVTLLIISGFGLSGMMRLNTVETGWILWSIILVIISGAVYMAKVVRIQKKILTLTSDENKFKWDEYNNLAKQWDLWGSIATITSYIALVLMVYKYAILS
jgi:uncharacterized membrane protein